MAGEAGDRSHNQTLRERELRQQAFSSFTGEAETALHEPRAVPPEFVEVWLQERHDAYVKRGGRVSSGERCH